MPSDLLFVIPDLTGNWQLELYMDSPVPPEEQEELLKRVVSAIRWTEEAVGHRHRHEAGRSGWGVDARRSHGPRSGETRCGRCLNRATGPPHPNHSRRDG
jgi:hypothetical protein